jgi:hypothetical protein
LKSELDLGPNREDWLLARNKLAAIRLKDAIDCADNCITPPFVRDWFVALFGKFHLPPERSD